MSRSTCNEYHLKMRCHISITDIFVDASFTGIGGVWGDLVYAVPVGRLTGLPVHCSIVHLEMINMFVALSLWSERLAGRTLVVHCDNAAVVCTLNSGRAQDEFLLKVARNIWLITAVYDIRLQVCHIPGKRNVIADTLSRWFSGCINVPTAQKFTGFQWCSVGSKDLTIDETI